MSKKNTSTSSTTATASVDLSREEIKTIVQEALDSGELMFEIPDDLIVGKFHARLSTLEAMVRNLTRELASVKASGGTQPAPEMPAGRIDTVEAAKAEKKTAKK